MSELNKNKVGLSLAILVSFLHLVWAVLVGISKTATQNIIDWILPLHFIDMLVSITTFSWINALMLVIMSFVGGYILGWLFAFSWNILNKK